MILNFINTPGKNYIKGIVACFAMVLVVAFANATSTEAPRKQSDKNNKEIFTVVIDAGHGGHDHGAIDNGTREKDINLGVAKKFAANIKKKLKNVKIVMTRDDDTFISLQERANIANRNRGNLFVSIHTNSVDKKNPNRKTVSGTSVYALGPQKDANNLKVAQRENSVIELEDNYHQKYSGFDPSKDESYIIFEMAQKKNLGLSLKFADYAQKELVATSGRKDRGVKQAGFWVLWATSMPSVLVELDFICNPQEAAFLASEKGQQKLADALTNALEKYIESYRNQSSNASTSAIKNTEPVDDGKSVAASELAESKETENRQIVKTVDYEGVNTLVSTSEMAQNKRTTTKAAPVQNNNRTGSRKRRSESSRQNSDKRTLETSSIKLKYEQELLARQEKQLDDTKPETEVVTQPVNDTGNKKKKKEKKKKETSRKNISKNSGVTVASTKSQVKNNVTSEESKAAGYLKSDVKEVKGKKTFVVRQQNAPTGKMIYKIQIAASTKELSKNDPAFCGLTPSGMFVENDLYKYTYGESSDRREIEKMLLDIKSLVPDAFIIVRME